MEKSYREVDLEVIASLKAKGFTNVQLVLQPSSIPPRAVVEIIPGRKLDFQLDSISLKGRESLYYFGESSTMTTYVIDQDYLSMSEV